MHKELIWASEVEAGMLIKIAGTYYRIKETNIVDETVEIVLVVWVKPRLYSTLVLSVHAPMTVHRV